MDRKEIRDDYYAVSGLASGVARALALAGIAVVWVFREQSDAGYHIPDALRLPAIFLIIALACDLLHYFYQAAYLGIYNLWLHYKDVPEKQTVQVPAWLPIPGVVLWTGKMLATIGGYALLLDFMARNLT